MWEDEQGWSDYSNTPNYTFPQVDFGGDSWEAPASPWQGGGWEQPPPSPEPSNFNPFQDQRAGERQEYQAPHTPKEFYSGATQAPGLPSWMKPVQVNDPLNDPLPMWRGLMAPLFGQPMISNGEPWEWGQVMSPVAYHGFGGAGGAGLGGGWWSTNPSRAASYGPNVLKSFIPDDVWQAGMDLARKYGSYTSGDAVLPAKWLQGATPVSVKPKVFSLD